MLARPRAGIRQHAIVFVVGGLMAVAASWASDLSVTGPAARAGSYGLEVSAGNTCTAGNDVVIPDQSVGGTTTFNGCRTLTAANVDILTSGDVMFQAGDRITLQNGFSVASGAVFTAAIDQAMTGRAYVQDDTPSAEQLYRARFYVDISSLNPGSGEIFDHFTAHAGNGAPEFALRLEASGSNIALVVSARNDSAGGGYSEVTADAALPTSYCAIEFEWQAADSGMTNGYLDVWVDGSQVTGLSGLDNQFGQIDFVRWGIVDGVTSSTTGTMSLDEFVSQRSSTSIGLLP